MLTDVRPSWIEIDLGALAANTRSILQLVGPDVQLFAVLKGDGYGCGAVAVARTVLEAGAYAVAAADPNEVLALRAAGISAPILLYPCSLPSAAAAIANLGVIVTIHDFESLGAFAQLARPIRAFVKIDTGLNRLGFGPESWDRAFALCVASPNLTILGLASHFPTPLLPTDAADLAGPSNLLLDAQRAAQLAGLGDLRLMAASSPFVAAFPSTHYSAVDPGRILYDLIDDEWQGTARIRPVFRAIKSRVIQVKDVAPGTKVGYGRTDRAQARRVAVLPIGFTDGLPSSHAGDVLIEGERAPILSQLSMEHTVVDVSAIAAAVVGSEAVLLGHQGDEEVTAAELARSTGLTEFEVLVRLGNALRRVYIS